MLLGLCLLLASPLYWTHDLLTVYEQPDRIGRRAGTLTYNINGEVSYFAHTVRFRVNDAPWSPAGRGLPRARRPRFIIEIPRESLRAGRNRVEIEAEALARSTARATVEFEYTDRPPELPLTVDWSQQGLDAQDGRWETFRQGAEWRVRPAPGYEDYDRILLVTGAFAGGRRVETDLVFHHVGRKSPKGDFGFGVFGMWAGHPGPSPIRPRRGWSFGMAWYWNIHSGIGPEFSHHTGESAAQWVNSYRYLDLEPGVRYRLILESIPEQDEQGRHRSYLMRLKWWRDGEPPPAHWMELRDVEGATLPETEYAVALMAFYAQVDFGPVRVTALPPRPTKR